MILTQREIDLYTARTADPFSVQELLEMGPHLIERMLESITTNQDKDKAVMAARTLLIALAQARGLEERQRRVEP